MSSPDANVQSATLLVDVRNLRVVRGRTPIIDGLDIALRPGEVVALRGPSGAGKTTVLSALTGLVPSSSDRLHIGGVDVRGAGERRRARHRLEVCGVVFQHDALLPELTVWENISLPLRLLNRRASVDALRAQVETLVGSLGLGHHLDKWPHQLSGGQLQRAAIARALIHAPQLVLADEATAALDSETARKSMSMLVEMVRQSNAAAIIVTHDAQVARMCDRQVTITEAAPNDPSGATGR